MEKLGVLLSLTSGYDLQSNGQVERANQEIGCFLHGFCQDNQTVLNIMHGLSMHKIHFVNLLYMSPHSNMCSWLLTTIIFMEHLPYWCTSCGLMVSVEQTSTATHQQLEHAAQRTKHLDDHHRGETPQYAPGYWMWLYQPVCILAHSRSFSVSVMSCTNWAWASKIFSWSHSTATVPMHPHFLELKQKGNSNTWRNEKATTPKTTAGFWPKTFWNHSCEKNFSSIFFNSVCLHSTFKNGHCHKAASEKYLNSN